MVSVFLISLEKLGEVNGKLKFSAVLQIGNESNKEIIKSFKYRSFFLKNTLRIISFDDVRTRILHILNFEQRNQFLKQEMK